MRPALTLALLLSTTAFLGCIGSDDDVEPSSTDPTATPVPVPEYDLDGPTSRVLETGPYDVLPMEAIDIPSFDGTIIASALWRPDLPEGEKAPVILVVSPYWGNGLYFADLRTEEFYLRNYVSHGYAYAKVAIRGTSYSSGCMESMGPNEHKDIDEVVTHYGTQDWSNGNVAIIGVSYVGTTPWAAAQFGNPHLKTIVPISGVTDWFELGFRNGTAEPRTPFHMALYWQGGMEGKAYWTLNGGGRPSDFVDNACTAPIEGTIVSNYAVLTGEHMPGPFDQYWIDRNLQPKVLENYEGSVFLVHGLQDWNVDADMAYPFVNKLEAKGVEVKHLLGQWQHSWPDAMFRTEHLRVDFAQTLLTWFDRHLKGMDVDTGPKVDVEDSAGLWRTEPTWPPTDRTIVEYHLGDGVLSAEKTAAGSAVGINPGGLVDAEDCAAWYGIDALRVDTPGVWTFRMPIDEELRFAGHIRMPTTFIPTDPRGGAVYAELWNVGEDVQRVAHASMNLRFHKGSHEAQDITPGEPVLAMLEFYPADVVIPAGNELVLRILPEAGLEACEGFLSNFELTIHKPSIPTSGAPMQIVWGDGASVLRLPVIQRDVGDGTYVGQPE